MPRTVLLAAAVLAALLAAGCSSHSGTPVAAVSPSGTAAAVSLPAGCASVLGTLPKSPPDTAQQAADDTNALGGHKGTTAGSLADAVSADSFSIGFDLSENQSVSADVAKWQADAKVLRSYCG